MKLSQLGHSSRHITHTKDSTLASNKTMLMRARIYDTCPSIHQELFSVLTIGSPGIIGQYTYVLLLLAQLTRAPDA